MAPPGSEVILNVRARQASSVLMLLDNEYSLLCSCHTCPCVGAVPRRRLLPWDLVLNGAPATPARHALTHEH